MQFPALCPCWRLNNFPVILHLPWGFPLGWSNLAGWAIMYLKVLKQPIRTPSCGKCPEMEKSVFWMVTSISDAPTLLKSLCVSACTCLPLWARDKPTFEGLIRSHPGRARQNRSELPAVQPWLIPRTYQTLSLATNVKTITSIKALLTSDTTDKYFCSVQQNISGTTEMLSALSNMAVTSH